jgi:hypothetical protein
MPLFTAAITRGASPINPDTIEINDNSVIYKKRRIYLVGYDKIIIPFSKIASVEIDTGIIGTRITIHSYGLGTITAHPFTLGDANEIKRLIEMHI